MPRRLLRSLICNAENNGNYRLSRLTQALGHVKAGVMNHKPINLIQPVFIRIHKSVPCTRYPCRLISVEVPKEQNEVPIPCPPRVHHSDHSEKRTSRYLVP